MTRRLFVLAIVLCAGVQAQNGRFAITMRAANPSLKDHPVMVSAISKGAIVRQNQTFLNGGDVGIAIDDLAHGVYDVRIEGEGVVTEVQRGVQLLTGQANLVFLVRPGTGVHIVEYATGGLAREEVAARLQRLDAEVADLQKKVAAK
jgi:hypothetical protein